ncbi:protein translocase subunit SecDF [Membranicola marinus]|uniref:Multifunctional fusion protein n=1 Tax=Membranihabitans marinus TaxID=1227546 RepID=A0A953LC08_9BACT|nr:protein translocase subunit SecDF [Membranihabitans marinus]MBY5957269.1 protein translocase subunit SecDF [Membranihabitans marinus]
MQAKGVIKFFLILFAIVSAFQYLLIYPTWKVEKQADEYAERIGQRGDTQKEIDSLTKDAHIAYLDSMSGVPIFNIPLIKDYTYEELKGQQLALGLDLKGGLSALLQVDLKDFLENLSKNSQDPTFRQALNNAEERMRETGADFMSAFQTEWSSLANGKTLASIFAKNEVLAEDITFGSPDNAVMAVLRQKASETVKLTFNRLKDRIDKFGVSQPNISLDQSRNIIMVELPGVENYERARNYLQAQANLEFWNVYRVTDNNLIQTLSRANERLKQLQAGDTAALNQTIDLTQKDTIKTAVLDSLGNPTGDSTTQIVDVPQGENAFQSGPLFSNFTPNITGSLGLAAMGEAERNKRNIVMEYLQKPEIKSMFPSDIAFLWGSEPRRDYTSGEKTNKYVLYAIKKGRANAEAPLSGEHIVSATTAPDPITNEVAVSLKMDNQGARIWADMTTKAAQDNNREIAIVLDDEVVSAPSVNTPITDGNSSITGNFTVQEGNDLAAVLEVGKLPAKTKIISESLVGPSLGKDNIRKSVVSLVSGFLLVMVFMIFYYNGGGVVSIIALFTNLFFIFGALASYGTVLTLPGFAGIILTIGMAVDANVIIYERIKEELRAGKSTLNAVKDGFRHSYSAIIDANVTTLLVAVILAYFGVGPIKGFAVVLIWGVIFSFITAVWVTRLVIDYWNGKDKKLVSFMRPTTKGFLANINIDWLGKRKKAYIFSITLTLIGLISIFTRGWELGVDFKGGYSYNIEFPQNTEVSVGDLSDALTDAFDSEPVVKSIDVGNHYNVTTSYLIDDTSEDAPDRVRQKLFEGVNAVMGGNLDYEEFRAPEGQGTHIVSSSQVGPTIAEDIMKSSWEAILFSLIAIFLYIFIRFSKWQYSLGAVIAIFHDTLVILGIFSLLRGILPFSLEIDQAFIAAILTVIGYSMNDTVIVYDRIRENFNSYSKKSRYQLINDAINSTMSRTLITSGTTILVIMLLLIFGGSSIKGFAFAITFGIFFGTYSSIFIASPILYDLLGAGKDKKTAPEKSEKQTATV